MYISKLINSKFESELDSIILAQKIVFQYKGKVLTKYFAKRIDGPSITEKFRCLYPNAKIVEINVLSDNELKNVVKKNVTDNNFLLF